jgi:hypothetical protein
MGVYDKEENSQVYQERSDDLKEKMVEMKDMMRDHRERITASE